MAQRRREFVDSRLRRCPPDRASAVTYGQAGENALRFPHLAHRSAAVHKLHSATATTRIDFNSGKGKTFSRLPALAYSSRNLSKRPGPPHFEMAREVFRDIFAIEWADDRHGDAEERFVTVGMVEGRLLFVTYTLRERAHSHHLGAGRRSRASGGDTTMKTKHDWSRLDAMTEEQRTRPRSPIRTRNRCRTRTWIA